MSVTAWLDERIWCHPKFTEVSDAAFRVYIHGLAYSDGFGCRGVLLSGQQQRIGSTPRLRRELVEGRLWEERDGGAVEIHDWQEHNGKRDDRKAFDRERKRVARLSAQKNGVSPQDVPVDVP